MEDSRRLLIIKLLSLYKSNQPICFDHIMFLMHGFINFLSPFFLFFSISHVLFSSLCSRILSPSHLWSAPMNGEVGVVSAVLRCPPFSRFPAPSSLLLSPSGASPSVIHLSVLLGLGDDAHPSKTLSGSQPYSYQSDHIFFAGHFGRLESLQKQNATGRSTTLIFF